MSNRLTHSPSHFPSFGCLWWYGPSLNWCAKSLKRRRWLQLLTHLLSIHSFVFHPSFLDIPSPGGLFTDPPIHTWSVLTLFWFISKIPQIIHPYIPRLTYPSHFTSHSSAGDLNIYILCVESTYALTVSFSFFRLFMVVQAFTYYNQLMREVTEEVQFYPITIHHFSTTSSYPLCYPT